MDMDDRFAEISFWLPGGQKPETLSVEAEEEDSMIPARLYASGQTGMYGPAEERRF